MRRESLFIFLVTAFVISGSALASEANDNTPNIGEFLQTDQGDYIQRLKDSYNPESLSRLMCLDQVTIDWKGRFYDCDFNLALDLPEGGWSDLDSYTENSGIGSKIFTDYHCLSCTAGSGRNCRGNFT